MRLFSSSYPYPLSRGELLTHHRKLQKGNSIVNHRSQRPAPASSPFQRGWGNATFPSFIPLTPLRRGKADAPQETPKRQFNCQPPKPVTRSRELPFSKGLGVCCISFFLPLAPLKRGTAVAPKGAPKKEIQLSTTVASDLLPRAPLFKGAGGMLHFLLSYPWPLSRGELLPHHRKLQKGNSIVNHRSQ